MAQQQFNVAMFPADIGGCGHYRMKFPVWSLQTNAKNIRVIDSMKLIGDPRFFYDIRCVRIQRQVNDAQCDYFLKFLKPLSDSIGFWTIYEVDDVIKYEDIPLYNHGRTAYENKQFFANVKNILQGCDFLTVTTDTLRQYYIDNYELEEDKVVTIPNYLPRWWIGEAYREDLIKERYDVHKDKPRIGLPLSSSHYDLTGINNYIDDFSIISDFVRSTVKKYQWVVVGHVPKKIEDLIKSKQVECVPGSDLLNYPREMVDRGKFNAIVAPLQDNVFNRCKSNIKLLESWALGIPCIVQDLSCYSPYTKMTFKDNNELQIQLDNLFKDKKKYIKTVKNNRKIIDYGDTRSPNGWWLEKNLSKWFQLFTAPQKTIRLDLTKEGQDKKSQSEPEKETSLIELDLSI